MSFWLDDKIDVYCRYCQKNGELIYLTCTNDGGCEQRCAGYICENCVDDDDPRTFQQNCASCDGIFYQSRMPEMCDSCIAMICQKCVDDKNYYKCYRCNYRLCTECVDFVTYGSKSYPSCHRHLVKETRCLYDQIKDKSGHTRRCRHVPGPDRKFCKQHTYHHKRRIYK